MVVVVRTLNPHQLFIQRIHRDVDLWVHTMLPKLEAFYFKALSPELASPREGKSPGIREPGIWHIPSTKQQSQNKRKRSKSCRNPRHRKHAGNSSTSSDSDSAEHAEPKQPSLKCNYQLQKAVTQHTIDQATSSHQQPKNLRDQPCGLSKCERSSQHCSTSSNTKLADRGSKEPAAVHHRGRRQKTVKFIGRCILYEWVVDDESQQKVWYKGTVISVLSGTDGDEDAVYEVIYEDGDDCYEIDNSLRDYQSGSAKFGDL